VNYQVVNFFKNIANLLQNCTFYFGNIWENEIPSIKDLLEFLVDKIFKFVVETNLSEFNQQFPGILDQIQSLQFRNYYENHNDEIEIILNWLANGSKNGKQKTIEYGFNYDQNFVTSLIKGVKEV